MLKTIFSSIIEISIVSSIVIALLAILYTFINKRYAAKWRCAIWIVIMLRLMVPINISIPSAPIVVPEPPKQEVVVNRPIQQEAQPIANEQVKNITNTTPTPPQPRLSEKATVPTEPVTVWIDKILIAAYVWLFGMLIISTFYGFKRIRFQQYLKSNSTKIDQKRLLSMITQLSKEIRLSKEVTPILCKGISSPMVIGLVKPKLLLPMLNYSNQDLMAVLRHELIHIKKNHLWFKFGMLLCEIVYWFNPFVYLMTRLAQRDIEYACDSAVLKYTSESYKEEYSRAILSVIENTLWGNKRTMMVLSTGFSEGKRTLKKRFQNIFSDSKKKKGVIFTAILILIITIVSSLFVFGSKDVRQDNNSLTIYTLRGENYDIVTGIYGYDVDQIVSVFKSKYPEVKVNIKEFNCSSEEFYQKLSTELMAGKGPDVITMDGEFFENKDVYKLMKAGVFSNLDDFIKQDKDINLDDYYKPIMDEGMYKNKRYIIPIQFTVPVLVSGESALKEAGIEASSCQSNFWGFANEINKYTSINSVNLKPRVFYRKNELLQQIEYMGIRGAFDYNSNNVKFDTKEFKKALDLYKPVYMFEESKGQIEANDQATLIRDRQILFGGSVNIYPGGVMYNVPRILSYDQSVVIPVKTVDGGIEAQISNSAAIRNNSANKENAYNFIKILISPTGIYSFNQKCIPTNKFYAKQYVYSLTNGSDYAYDAVNDIKPQPTPQSYYREFYDIVDQVDGAHFYTPLTNQLIDYMKPYLEGKKSYEECIKEAKQKFELYLSE